MNSPCFKHVDCPPGTGTDSPGTNYSSEHIDVPEFPSVYYPPTPYGTHTACAGRCISLISQQDADLCAQGLGKICLIDKGGPSNGLPGPEPKKTFTNTQQICQIPSTGKLVIVPAGVFVADSQADADAQALSYANKLQVDPKTPPGVTTVPPPSTGGPGPVIRIPPIPGPTPQPKKKPTPPPMSQCKPCDDTVGVDTFVIVADLPMGTSSQIWDSAPLKCGIWKIEVSADTIDVSARSYLNVGWFTANPDQTQVPAESFVEGSQPAWVAPCGNGTDCSPQDVGQFGFVPGCCSQKDSITKYLQCQELPDGNFLIFARIYFTCNDAQPDTPAKHFTVTGTWLGPVPPT